MKLGLIFRRRSIVFLSFLSLLFSLIWFLQNKSKPKYIQASLGAKSNLTLEVVTKPKEIEQGLSGRDEIGSDGLLFIFPQVAKHSFWMKEMKFALDLVWLRDKKIMEITPRAQPPQPGVNSENLATYQPSQPVDMVLEVEAGRAEKWGLEVGDELAVTNCFSSKNTLFEYKNSSKPPRRDLLDFSLRGSSELPRREKTRSALEGKF